MITGGVKPGRHWLRRRWPGSRSADPCAECRVGPRPAIINQAFAKRFFPNMDPLRKRFGPSFNSPANGRAEVVGVVSDAKYRSLREQSPPVYYTPLLADTDLTWPMVLHVQTWGNPLKVIDAVRAQLRRVDPGVPFYDVQTMSQQVEASLWQEKLVTRLCSIFAFMAALLAAIGLYGVLDYSVKQRTHEIGIRMALGAQRDVVVWMVLRQTLPLVTTGFAIGLPATLAAGRLVSSRLYGVTPNDVVTMIAAVILVAAISALAGYVPARRASNVHPMDALRWE